MASSGGSGGTGGPGSNDNEDKAAEPKFRPSRDGARPGSQAHLGRTAAGDAFRVPRSVNGIDMVDSIPRPTTSAGHRALNMVMVGTFPPIPNLIAHFSSSMTQAPCNEP